MPLPAAAATCPLLRTPEPAVFCAALRFLDRGYRLWAATSPAPLPASGLIVSPETRRQSELYLPIADVSRYFDRFYERCLTYPPLLASTPFFHALSWADLFSGLPSHFQYSPNPARFLELLLNDQSLRCWFLFHSFLPQRYNGAGFDRYPAQNACLRELLAHRLTVADGGAFRCLDAACGSGEGTWELAEQFAAAGWHPEQVQLEGWTLDPLEVWAARHRCLPHAPARQESYCRRTAPLLKQGWGGQIRFREADLLGSIPLPSGTTGFDLILCNGLLGGPFVNRPADLRHVIARLAALLRPGGCLMAADRFHDGWKRQTPEELLRGLCETAGLRSERRGEGIIAFRT